MIIIKWSDAASVLHACARPAQRDISALELAFGSIAADRLITSCPLWKSLPVCGDDRQTWQNCDDFHLNISARMYGCLLHLLSRAIQIIIIHLRVLLLVMTAFICLFVAGIVYRKWNEWTLCRPFLFKSSKQKPPTTNPDLAPACEVRHNLRLRVIEDRQICIVPNYALADFAQSWGNGLIIITVSA